MGAVQMHAAHYDALKQNDVIGGGINRITMLTIDTLYNSASSSLMNTFCSCYPILNFQSNAVVHSYDSIFF